MIACVVRTGADEVAASAFVRSAVERGEEPYVIGVGPGEPLDRDLLEAPDAWVTLGEASPAVTIGVALPAIESELGGAGMAHTVVFGSHDAALAATLASAKLHVPVWAAGLDAVGGANASIVGALSAGIFAATDASAASLAAAGLQGGRVAVTGPLAAETLERHRHTALPRGAWRERGLEPGGYVLTSLAAPARLPRHALSFADATGVGYLDRLSLVAGAAAVLTDSADLQLEALLLRVPCVVAAPATPLPVAVASGAVAAGERDPEVLASAIAEQAQRGDRTWQAPPLHDAGVSTRMLDRMAAL
jgi:UDP-N-acetylglucosamine 2-epimerase